MATIFSRIIAGEIPCCKIAEDEHYFAFLDIRPISRGHTLVIPKNETDYLFDLDDDTLAGILLFSRPIAAAIRKVVPCRRIGILVAGLEVPHAHVHLVPITGEGDLSFANARPAEISTLIELAKEIRMHLS